MFSSVLALVVSISFAATNSEKYQALIDDNALRLRFTDAQNAKLNRRLKDNAAVKADLRAMYAEPTVRQTLKLDGNREIHWIDRGVGQASELALVENGAAQVFYSTWAQQIGNAAVITGLALSPKGDYLLATLAKYGSIDQKEGVLFDLRTRAEVARLNLYFESAMWTGPSELSYPRSKENGESENVTLDPATGAERPTEYVASVESRDYVVVARAGKNYLVHKLTGERRELKAEGRLAASGGNTAYFLKTTGKTSIVQALDWPTMTTRPFADTATVSRVWTDRGGVFLHVRQDLRREIHVHFLGQRLGVANVPDGGSVTAVAWREPGKTLEVTLTSAAWPKRVLTYEIATNAWSDPEALLAREGLALKTELLWSKSADGTSVPSRLTYRSDLPKDGARTAYVKAYGGFNVPGYVDPYFDRAIFEFLKRGGLFVAPAPRGGNELGPPWHEAAMREKKRRTFEDVDAVARQLVKEGWTTPKKIALQGTSNGGLTAAATALLFPRDFALAIPIAGVQDLIGKDKLDAIYEGWAEEYGSYAKGAKYVAQWSPVEIASKQSGVRFLIIDGAQDTRVNPAHSVKLAKALLDQGGSPENVFLFTVANAGHGTQSVVTNSSIGLAVQIAIWTMIYDL